MEIDVFTLFPEWFEWFSEQRHIAQRARRRIEDRVRRLPPAHAALAAGRWTTRRSAAARGWCCAWTCSTARCARVTASTRCELRARRRVIALAPGGRLLDEALVDELAGEPALTLLCGRYEGFDERIVEHFASDVVSIGRYVLAGGELAAMVICDAVLRKLPGALGDERSAAEESFSAALEGNPEYPHYTRPAEYRGWKRARGAALRPPRRDRALAAERSRERGAAAGGRQTAAAARAETAGRGRGYRRARRVRGRFATMTTAQSELAAFAATERASSPL